LFVDELSSADVGDTDEEVEEEEEDVDVEMGEEDDDVPVVPDPFTFGSVK